MKNTIYELKNTVKWITTSLDEAEDLISELEDRVAKNFTERATKWKQIKKESRGFEGASGQHET